MKKPSLPFKFWVILHAGLVISLVLSAVLSNAPLSVNTNLTDLLPPFSYKQDMAEADRLFSRRHNRDFVILAGGEDFSRVKENAEKFYRQLEQSPGLFEELTFFIDEKMILDFSAYLHKYRYVLLDPETSLLLENGEAETIASEALARAYGAFTFSGLQYLDTDPFLLAERELRYFLESSLVTNGLSLRDGVLCAEKEGLHYVLLRGILSEAGASINKGGGVREIYRIAGELSQENAAEHTSVHFVFSGFPFHSHESSANARREITLIAAVTTLLLLFLFLWVFRSPLPALLIIFSAAVSVVMGLCAVFLVFRNVHILTFSLGTTLIGLSVDYSTHYFCRRKEGLSGPETRAVLLRGVSLCFVSSFVCFLIFLFAPFVILKQFALFSAAGLLSSYVTVLCLFADIIPALKKTDKPFPGIRQFKAVPANVKKAALAILGVVFLLLTFSGRGVLKIKNDIRSLYSIPPKLLEWEKTASSVLNYGTGNWFLVSGSNLQDLLENEEFLLARLNEADAGTFLGVSRFIPPVKTQERRYRSAEALLLLAEKQFEALGFPPESARLLRDDYAAIAGNYVLPDNVPPMVKQIVSALLFETGKPVFSAVMLLNTAKAGGKVNLDNYEWAAAVNKADDISAALDGITITMVKLLGIAYCIIVLGLLFFYRSILKTLRIAAVPVFAGLVSLAVHVLSGYSLSFFSLSGFILVLGLGLDYMFYLSEDSSASNTVLMTVVLSYLTSAVSFGALLFSSFMPIHLLALSVFPGLSVAFVWAMLVKK